MSKTRVLRDVSINIGEFWIAKIKLQQVPKNRNRPDGFKLNCVLIDTRLGKAVLILDNHHPFGYHLHPNASEHDQREELEIAHPKEAIQIFFQRIREMTT